MLSLSLGIAALPLSPDRVISAADARGGGGGGAGGGGGCGPCGCNGYGTGPGEECGRGGGNDFGQAVAAAAWGDNPRRGGGDGGSRGGDRGALAAQLGALNAAHASPTARANAALTSRVGMIAAYETAMRGAPTALEAALLAAHALPAAQQQAARDAALATFTTAQKEAMGLLNAAAHRSPLSDEAVAAVNPMLGIPAPTLTR